MVAILCGHGKYQNQYLDENKKWISDPDPKALCTKDKLEILEYCRKVSLLLRYSHLYLTSLYTSLCFLVFPILTRESNKLKIPEISEFQKDVRS